MNKKIILGFSLVAIVVAVIVVISVLNQRIPMNSSDVGNTAGNLQNSGLFFEMDGKVYFANASDSNCMYSMNPDESKPKRLTSMGVKYINGANGYLYFYMDSSSQSANLKGLGAATNQYGIYRCRANGRDQTCILRELVGEIQLCGEYLYYQVKTGGGSLQKMKPNQTDQQLVMNEAASPVCYSDGVIYYTGVSQDHDIHALYTQSGDRGATVINGNYFFPVVQDGFIYYLNGTSNYSIWRTNLYTGEQQLITSDRADCFTMDSQHIYYSFSNANTPALKRCDLDGGNNVVLYDGIVNSINLTSQYVYFKVYGNDTMLYHMPLDGSAPASQFLVLSK